MLYTKFKLNRDDANDFYGSTYGYVVEPDGTILSLTELQVHGKIAYERNPGVRKYYDALDEDRKSRSMTAAEVYATDELGHVRISIAPYIYQWSVGTSWNKPVTAEQKKSLKFLFDMFGPDEIWTNTGEMDSRDFLKGL